MYNDVQSYKQKKGRIKKVIRIIKAEKMIEVLKPVKAADGGNYGN